MACLCGHAGHCWGPWSLEPLGHCPLATHQMAVWAPSPHGTYIVGGISPMSGYAGHSPLAPAPNVRRESNARHAPNFRHATDVRRARDVRHTSDVTIVRCAPGARHAPNGHACPHEALRVPMGHPVGPISYQLGTCVCVCVCGPAWTGQAWAAKDRPGLCGHTGHSCPLCGHAGHSWRLCGHAGPSSLRSPHMPLSLSLTHPLFLPLIPPSWRYPPLLFPPLY